MVNFTMMVGLPGSGKSWVANLLAKKNATIKIFSSDEYRKMLYGDENCQDNPEKVFNLLYKDMIQHLENGYDAIFDATNTTLKGRMHVLKMVKNAKIYPKQLHTTCYVVNTPFFMCVKRDEERKRTVGAKVIRKFMLSFQCPQYFEGWDQIIINELPEDGWCDYENAGKILGEMNNFDQKNPHHIYNLGEHCKQVCDIFYRQEDDLIRNQAGLWHDIGKLHTQHFDEYGIAHYYGHDNVGAYQILCNLELLPPSLNVDEKLEIIFYINYHMRAHKDFRPGKAYNKYSQIFGKEKLDKLLEFADADIEASGTKDCHDEVMRKIEELKNSNGSKN